MIVILFYHAGDNRLLIGHLTCDPRRTIWLSLCSWEHAGTDIQNVLIIIVSAHLSVRLYQTQAIWSYSGGRETGQLAHNILPQSSDWFSSSQSRPHWRAHLLPNHMFLFSTGLGFTFSYTAALVFILRWLQLAFLWSPVVLPKLITWASRHQTIPQSSARSKSSSQPLVHSNTNIGKCYQVQGCFMLLFLFLSCIRHPPPRQACSSHCNLYL